MFGNVIVGCSADAARFAGRVRRTAGGRSCESQAFWRLFCGPYENCMELTCSHPELRQRLAALGLKAAPERTFTTGLAGIDDLLNGRGLAMGAIHEVLSDEKASDEKGSEAFCAKRPLGRSDKRLLTPFQPLFFSMVLARSALGRGQGAVVWFDPAGEIYPPALAAGGIDPARLILLRCREAEQIWAMAECLRCRGVSTVVGAVQRLTDIEARRLQLAAEKGGGVGILLRHDRLAGHYAAATRWLVSPAKGERTVHRWMIQLLHGQGGRIGGKAILELCRESHLVRAVGELADRSAATKPSRVPA